MSAFDGPSLVEEALAEIEAHDVFPERGRALAGEIRRRMRQGAYRDLDLPGLCQALTRDLRSSSGDLHLGLRPGGDGPDSQAVRAERMRSGGYGIARVERRPGNIGLLELRYFAPAGSAGAAMAAAMQLLADRDALIIDLRRAKGGDPGMIALASSYLFDAADPPRHLNDIHHRDGRVHQWWTLPWLPGPRIGAGAPLALLTSRETFSGAEEFAWNLRALGRATLLGERTAGAAHPTRSWPIAGGLALVDVPFARSINPHTGDNWEGRGIRPDLELPAAEAELRAVAWLLEQLAERARQRGDAGARARLERHRQALGGSESG